MVWEGVSDAETPGSRVGAECDTFSTSPCCEGRPWTLMCFRSETWPLVEGHGVLGGG